MKLKDIENGFEKIKETLILSKYFKKFWIYKNQTIVLDLSVKGNNVVFSSIPDFKTNSLKVILWSRNNLKELSFLDGKFDKTDTDRYIIFEDSLEKIDLAIHTINKYIYEVEKELVYNKPKTYDSILVKQKEGATATILAFSSINTKRGNFTFYKTFENIDANVIFINDYASLWYTNGTPDFSSEYEFEKYIKDILDTLDTKELFTFGSSMGGYGAMKYGSVFQADSVIAMCPEIEFSMPFSQSIKKVSSLKKGGGI